MKKGEFYKAAKQYDRGLDYVDYMRTTDPEIQKQLQQIRIALHLNKCLCCIRLPRPRWKAALREADAVLALDAHNAKALFRRATCRRAKGDILLARDDLRAALEAAPTDIGIRNMLRDVEAEIKKVHQKQKNTFRGMFEKMQQMEREEQKEREKDSITDFPESENTKSNEDNTTETTSAVDTIQPESKKEKED